MDTTASNLVGIYEHVFNKSQKEEMLKGNFVFQKKGGGGYIFKNEDGIWSVSKFAFV